MYCAGQAQNLVIDPGFESPRRIPQKADNSIYCTKNWSSTNGAGDYYHQDAGRHAGVPHNIFGRQKPHGGKAYGGICIRRHFIEYLETKLSEPLVKDEDYLVEYYISRAERSIGSVNEFGVIFTRRLILGSSNQGMPIKPALDFVSTKKYSNKKKWTKMSGVYRAKGDEQVVVIGYFNYDHPDGQRIFAHYYIDDVSVTLIEEKTQPLDKTEPAETVKPQDSLSSSFAPKPGERFTLKNIFFDTNKSELLPASFSELDKLVQYLKGNTHSITINGHTDNIGNENQNKELSETRAEAVADYLILKGIDASRIKYEGYGSTMPVASNDSEKGKQENRRVEIVIGSK
jgi:outer membrane protein OmpA-like peptidoglycan-associated protein